MNKITSAILGAALLLLVTLFVPLSTHAQGTAFTYQGFLTSQGAPANGSFDLQLAVFDAASGGAQQGVTVQSNAFGITNGLFTVTIDPGANVFTGAARWLNIGVRPAGTSTFTNVVPRQPIRATPYAVFAGSAATAATAGSMAASNLTGIIPVAALPAVVVTNGESGVTISGTFSGNGAGVTNVAIGNLNASGFFTWPGNFTLTSSPGVGSNPQSVVAADVNGDGKLDLISANYNASTLTVLTNNGSGGFVLASSPGVGSGPYSVVAADVNGDGKVDLISVNGNSNTLSVLTNNGSGGFVLASSPGVGSGPYSVVATDVNGDGKVDLISANYNANTLTVLTNNGSGGFVLASSPGVGINPTALCAADVNGDGKVDLISANYNANTLTVLTNNGSGGFVLSSSPGVGSGPASVVATDVNGDGTADLVSANYGASTGNTLTVLTNNGSGGFVLASSPGVGTGPSWLAVADVNGDGRGDLISANYNANTLTVLTNNGSGSFALASSPGVSIGPISVVAADVNGDGKVDLISANAGNYTLSVLFNTPTVNGSFNGSFSGNLTGNVGIGKINPATALDVNGTVTATNFIGNGAGLTNVWHQGGDNVSVGQFLGSTNNQPVEIWVNGMRGMRLEPGTGGALNIVAGSFGNAVSPGVVGAVIAGGGTTNSARTNRVAASYSSIGGGSGNTIQASADHSTISGGYSNLVSTLNPLNPSPPQFSTIAGGALNQIGHTNRTFTFSVNNPYNFCSTISGGGANAILDGNVGSTISGGTGNLILSNADYAVIPGGSRNIAGGRYSFAAGQQAQAQHGGAFVWADSQSAAFASTAANQFLIRAAGGVGINTTNPGSSSLSVYGTNTGGWPYPTTFLHNGSTDASASPALVLEGNGNMVDGVLAVRSTGTGYLARFGTANGGWLVNVSTNGTMDCVSLNQTSDRNAKENFTPLDAQAVLAKVAALPITEWNYKTDTTTRHVGPTAQDFSAAFGLNGGDDRHISVVDEGGVALAAIQGLNQKLEGRSRKAEGLIEELKAENAELKKSVAELKRLVEKLAEKK